MPASSQPAKLWPQHETPRLDEIVVQVGAQSRKDRGNRERPARSAAASTAPRRAELPLSLSVSWPTIGTVRCFGRARWLLVDAGGVSIVGPSPGSTAPAADISGVDVDEAGTRVIAHPTPSELDRGIAKRGEPGPLQAQIDGSTHHMQTAFGSPATISA